MVVNFSEFLVVPLELLKVSGIDMKQDAADKSRKAIAMRVYHWLFISLAFLTLPLTAITIVKNLANMELISKVFPSSVLAVLSLIKTYQLAIKIKPFKEALEICERMFPRTSQDQQELGVGRSFKQYKVLEWVFTKIFYTALGLVFVSMIFSLGVSGVWRQPLPTDYWFPFDPYDLKYYNFVLFWETYASFSILFVNTAFDLILFAMVTVVSIVHDHLCKKIKNLAEALEENIGQEITNIVEIHNEMIKVINTLELIFSASIFFYFIGNTMILCMVGFQAIYGNDIKNSVIFAGFLGVTSVQTLLLCFFGSKIIDSSDKLAQSAFESGWHEAKDSRIKNMTLMMIVRCQKPPVLTSLKFSIISLNVYGSVSNWERCLN